MEAPTANAGRGKWVGGAETLYSIDSGLVVSYGLRADIEILRNKPNLVVMGPVTAKALLRGAR